METSKKTNKKGMVLGQNLGQISSNVVKKVKKTGIFQILPGGYLLKQKEVSLQTPEWKFKENIARNATFEGH